MTDTTILVAILTIAAVRPFIEVQHAMARGRALKAAGYTTPMPHIVMYVLLVPVMLTLWWWYAIAAGVVLLGIIPTVGMATTVLAVTVENVARKAEER